MTAEGRSEAIKGPALEKSCAGHSFIKGVDEINFDACRGQAKYVNLLVPCQESGGNPPPAALHGC